MKEGRRKWTEGRNNVVAVLCITMLFNSDLSISGT